MTTAEAPYPLRDTERDLARAFTDVPDGAASGNWTATTVQAGVSNMTGGDLDAAGAHVADTADQHRVVARAISAAVQLLEDAGSLAGRNMATVVWRRDGGQVVLATEFDPDIVPRGPDDPVYEQAAAARRRFWQTVGTPDPGYLSETAGTNVHGQTKWFQPHRRVILVRRTAGILLATDGLSTPWAGISDRENGVECEICLDLHDPLIRLGAGPEQIGRWAGLLIEMGDAGADSFQVPQSIAKDGPDATFKLGPSHAPANRIVLSGDDHPAVTPAGIEGLPFGAIRLLTATPVTEEDLSGPDLEGDAAGNVARIALGRHAARKLGPRP